MLVLLIDPEKEFTEILQQGRIGSSGESYAFNRRGVLISDDGYRTEAYNVDNDNSSTRARFIGEGKVTDDLTISGALEWQLESNSTADREALSNPPRKAARPDAGVVSGKHRRGASRLL